MKYKKDYDVVVAGGGIAGVAAAIEASRSGMKTALVEKTVFTGGLATTGLIFIYLPLCDGRGTQVTFGLSEELLRASIIYGPGDIPKGWENGVKGPPESRFLVRFSPASFIIALDELLVNAGVDVWFDTLVVGAVMDGQRITGIEVENKSGRGLISAKCFVDATGDADLAFQAGAPCVETDNWLSNWAIMASAGAAKKAAKDGNAKDLLNFFIIGGDNAGRGAPEKGKKYRGTDGKDVSEFILKSRELLINDLKNLYAKEGKEKRNDYYPLTLASMPQLRTTRRIDGLSTIRDDGHSKKISESVGLVADWRKSAFVWEVPYTSLLPKKVKGLIAAGRCISNERDAWEVMRVIPAAAFTGQVAGLSAAISIKNKINPDALAVKDIQNALKSKGIPLHIEDVCKL
jgi:succinate dehydrogenase/fumarate reductase flavoprotein subunit